MSVNLLSLFNDTISSELSAKAGKFLGESTANTDTALITILPAILGGLVHKGSSPEGASGLLEFMDKESIDGSLLEKSVEFLDGGKNTHKLLDTGESYLDEIFEKKTQIKSIVSLLTSRASLGQSSSSSIFKMTAPFFLHLLASHVKKESLDANGLAKLLDEQKNHLKLAAPSGLLDKLGLASLTEGVKGAVQRSSTTPPAPEPIPVEPKTQETTEEKSEEEEAQPAVEPSTNSIASRIGPWILLFVLAGAMLYFMKSCGGREGEEIVVVENPEEKDSTNEATNLTNQGEATQLEIPAGSSIRTVKGNVATIVLPSGAKLETATGSLLDRIYGFLTSGQEGPSTFVLDQLSYASESSTIQSSAFGLLGDISKILRAYPEAVVQIEHPVTTEAGPEMIQLAARRALSLRMALLDLGIDENRLVTINPDKETATSQTQGGSNATDTKTVLHIRVPS